MGWKERAEQLKFEQGFSWSELAEEMQSCFPLMDKQQVLEKVRRYLRGTKQYKQLNTKHKPSRRPIGVFSDTHIPFDHPNYLQFLIDTFKQYNVGQVVCCGDIVDHHALSRFQTETCAKGSYDELDMAIDRLKAYTNAFPKCRVALGNHDLIPERQAATLGIGKRYLKSLPELLELPKTWHIEEEFIIDGVLYKHGINCLGKDGAINTAIQERMSTVIGHSHAFAGCKYSANKRDIIFGLNVGCGIDIDAYAFAYGKYDKNRPILGCGIVFGSGNAVFVPMGNKYFRSEQTRC